MGDALLVMQKDLRLEWRSKVGIGQVLPFSLLVVLLFAFALDPDRGVLDSVTSGLFWVVVLFSALLLVPLVLLYALLSRTLESRVAREQRFAAETALSSAQREGSTGRIRRQARWPALWRATVGDLGLS